MITANANEFALHRVVEAFINIFVHAAFLLIAGFIFFVIERITERTRSWFFVLVFLLFSAASAVFVGKAGSSINYLYELVAAICVLTGAAMAWLGRNPWLRVAALAVVALIEKINQRAFPAIALYEPIGQPAFIATRWPKPVRDAIYANYEMTGRLAEALIYTPR